ncbi:MULTISPECIES: metal ABC transporter solute-binding protein, Zn/Mn family [Bacteria]
MNPTRRLLPIIALSAASALVLAGCAGATPGGESAGDGRLQVVASTNVYGQIVEEIGGDAVDVTSIITSTGQDPHSFEATAGDQLAVSRADLIIENGGGYDSFMESLVESSDASAHVITAAEFSHHWPEDEHAEDEHSEDEHAEDEHSDEEHAGHDHIVGFNEHVWYDPHTIEHVAEAIAEELSELDPESAATFEINAAAFVEQIGGLETSLGEIEASGAGAQVFVTEPVPVYLVTAAGLVNVTPEAFSEAVEEGQDVPPATLLESLDLVESGSVRIVIANSQTGGAETTQVIDAAEAQSIPVLEFSETLPEGQTYISWMQQNVEALSGGLAG